MRYLADTSVLTRLTVPSVREAVVALQGGVARCVVTDLELGFSARKGAEWDRIAGALRGLGVEDVAPADFQRALGVQRMLADAGLRGRKVPDLLIAAVADRHGLVVVHYDKDFELIAGVTGQRQQWIVPPGTVS